MANSAFSFDNTEPMDNNAFQDAMEMACDDAQDDYKKGSSLPSANYGEDDSSERDESFKIDEDDSDEHYNDLVGKKRKRKRNSTSTKTTGSDLSHSKLTDARIKAEGGEAFIIEEGALSLSHSQSSRVFGTFGHRDLPTVESLPPYQKRVSAELDSDDELMLEMREKGYSDRQIAEKLAKDGRVRYDPKSISTRIMRIRLAQAENFDFLIQEGIKEWEMEDDQRLAQAYALADIEISYEIERIRAWRFRKVSEYMRRLNKASLFSANACRIRYGELASGTARIPCDIDDDPDARREELENYRLSRKAARDKEQFERDTREAMEKRVKQALKLKNAQKAEDIAYRRAAKEEENAQRLLQKAAQAQLRSQNAAEHRKAKAERNAQIKQAASAPKKRVRNAKTDPFKALSTELKLSNLISEGPETVDPRSYLSMTDLKNLCTNRGLSTDNMMKKELVGSLIDADMEWSHEELRKLCKAKGLKTGGNKTVLRYQLALKAAQSCQSFEAGIKTAEEANDLGEEGMVANVG